MKSTLIPTLAVVFPLICTACVGQTQKPQSTQKSESSQTPQTASKDATVVSEIIIKYKRGATSDDKIRVRDTVQATLKKSVQTSAMRADGDPGFDVVTIHFPRRPTPPQMEAVIKKIESDNIVRFAEVNAVYVAQQQGNSAPNP